METTAEPLVQKVSSSWQELAAALSGGDFYLEWAAIGAAIAVAVILSLFIRRQVDAQLAKHPPRSIDTVFITRPLQLLTPIITLLYFSVMKPFINQWGNGIWLSAMASLTIAYMVARCVTLIIRSRFIAYLIAITVMVVALLQVTGFLTPVSEFLDGASFTIGTFKLSLLLIIKGGVVLAVVFWLASLSSSTLESYLRRSSSLSYSARELTVKFFKIFIYLTALMVGLSAVGIDLTAFAVFGGALGVGIGLGLQKITSNFVSGITLLLEKSIKVGDVIEIGNAMGTVRSLNVRYTLIETLDGRELMIPNEELVSTRVVSWTHTNNRARVEIKVGVAYDSDMALVKKLMLESATEHPACMKDQEIKCWMREFGDSAVNFLLAFWVADIRDGRFGPQSDVMFSILEKFRKHNIEIPFPQRVVHTNNG